MANKFKGKNLSFMVDGVEQRAEITSCVIQPEDGETDNLTFAEVDAGDSSEWYATVNGVSDYGAGSWWSFCDKIAGEVFEYILKPYGNETATQAQPHFTGEMKIPTAPPIGGTAGETFTFEQRLDCEDGKPTRVPAYA